MLDQGVLLQGRYRILHQIGGGGMGAVYRAWDTRLDVPVALKEMMSQPDLDPQTLVKLRQQFQQEATILARLDHPYLVNVTDFFEDGDNVYLVMKFIEGESLAERIKRQGALPETEVLAWASQLLDALAYCHSHGVIHRDVKPQNVIIRPDGQAVLVDFGLVKLWDPNDPRTKTAMRGMGTPEYAPPEQYDVAVGHTDPRSDLFSLGATLYHALTGQAPPTATRRIVDPTSLTPMRALAAGASVQTDMAVARAMELQPEARFQSTQEMAAALSTGAPAPPYTVPTKPQPTKVIPAARPAPPAPPPKRTWLWISLGVAGILVIGLCAAALGGFIALPAILDRGDQVSTPTTEHLTAPPPPTATPTGPPPTPTPTVEPIVDVSLRWSTIGQSVRGRDLEMAVIGDARGAAVVVVGSIQGDQPNTRDLVDYLINDFDRAPDRLPANVAFHFIPTINPDGNATGTRRNAHNVDLNRNWDTFDWTANPEQPGGVVRGAGGPRPHPEPETQSLANYLLSLKRQNSNLRVVLWHSSQRLSSGGHVYPGYTSSGLDRDALSLAYRYADATGYAVEEDWAPYETTGELITWCAEEGIEAIDIVIPNSLSGADRNLRGTTMEALLEMARFP